MSKREQVLQALFTRLSALSATEVRRNISLPVKIPSSGLVVLRDGNIGEPEILLSPVCYVFHHRAEIEVLVQKQTMPIMMPDLTVCWKLSGVCWRLIQRFPG